MTEYARRSIFDRMKGAAMLDVATYEEVEHDTEATGQAAVVVVIVAICTAIGAVWRGGPSIIAGPIGAVLGCSEGAVEQKLVRARATLRERRN